MVTNRGMQLAAGHALMAAALVLVVAGCATKGFVRKEVADARAYTDTQAGEARARADEAMNKATLAERLASGTLEYNEVSSHQVQFAFDDWQLESSAQSTLDQMATSISSHPRYVIEIRGYADEVGSNRYNYRLGHERADQVMRYLMTRHSVPSSRMAIISFGEDDPVADNSSEDGRAQNRRVQVRLLEEKVQGQPVSVIETP